MGDILGVRIPHQGAKGKLAMLAIVSVPVALAAGVGYGAIALVRQLRRPESDEERAARLEKVYREYPQ